MKLKQKPKAQTWFTISVIAILSLLLGIWLQQEEERYGFRLKSGILFSSRFNLNAFLLESDDGQPFTNQNLKGRWSLILFGSARCVPVCASTIQKLDEAYQVLAQANFHALPQVIFISTDPQHDSPKRLHHYLIQYNPSFIGLTGSTQMLHRLSHQMARATQKIKPIHFAAQDYQRSGVIWVVDPSGAVVAVLTHPETGEVIAKDVRRVQRIYRRSA